MLWVTRKRFAGITGSFEYVRGRDDELEFLARVQSGPDGGGADVELAQLRDR
jgi:hypothetical protein